MAACWLPMLAARNPEGHCSCRLIQETRLAQYRGNVGNLLQHWVLCEILVAGRNHAQDLAFIDAYSMAPFATEQLDVVRACSILSGTDFPENKHRTSRRGLISRKPMRKAAGTPIVPRLSENCGQADTHCCYAKKIRPLLRNSSSG